MKTANPFSRTFSVLLLCLALPLAAVAQVYTNWVGINVSSLPLATTISNVDNILLNQYDPSATNGFRTKRIPWTVLQGAISNALSTLLGGQVVSNFYAGNTFITNLTVNHITVTNVTVTSSLSGSNVTILTLTTTNGDGNLYNCLLYTSDAADE